ncbi:MAG: response regulator [Poseidonibacter sp.]|uniref:response regulator n=1 Tax=Poseidonibacter sp. TaxID=2321188 RepID=UPI00359DB94D
MNNKIKNILIVEDEAISAHYLINILDSLGFASIFEVSNADEAMRTIENNQIDLVFMDININGAIDGITCAHLINERYFLPIIYTTAYSDSQTIINASDTNIFGFLIKPFDLSTVEATIRVALKKIDLFKNITTNKPINSINNNLIDLGENQIYNLEAKILYIENCTIDFTKKEIELLYVLASNLNQSISFEILTDFVWGNKNISNSTIRDTVRRLRIKAPKLNIQTVVGLGYILKKA